MDLRVTLKKNYEFRRLYNKGKTAVTPYMVVYALKTGRNARRVGYTVSTKLGKAVVRNRIRRRRISRWLLSEIRFAGLPAAMQIYADLLTVCRPGHREIRCPEGRPACPETAAEMSSVSQGRL